MCLFGGDFNTTDATWIHILGAESKLQDNAHSAQLCVSTKRAEVQRRHGDTAIAINAYAVHQEAEWGKSFHKPRQLEPFSDAHDAVVVKLCWNNRAAWGRRTGAPPVKQAVPRHATPKLMPSAELNTPCSAEQPAGVNHSRRRWAEYESHPETTADIASSSSAAQHEPQCDVTLPTQSTSTTPPESNSKVVTQATLPLQTMALSSPQGQDTLPTPPTPRADQESQTKLEPQATPQLETVAPHASQGNHTWPTQADTWAAAESHSNVVPGASDPRDTAGAVETAFTDLLQSKHAQPAEQQDLYNLSNRLCSAPEVTAVRLCDGMGNLNPDPPASSSDEPASTLVLPSNSTPLYNALLIKLAESDDQFILEDMAGFGVHKEHAKKEPFGSAAKPASQLENPYDLGRRLENMLQRTNRLRAEYIGILKEQGDHRAHTPDKLIFDNTDMSKIINRWRNNPEEWSDAQLDPTLTPQERGRRLKSKFNTMLLNLVGNRELVHLFIKYPICDSPDPAAILRDFHSARQQWKASDHAIAMSAPPPPHEPGQERPSKQLWRLKRDYEHGQKLSAHVCCVGPHVMFSWTLADQQCYCDFISGQQFAKMKSAEKATRPPCHGAAQAIFDRMPRRTKY